MACPVAWIGSAAMSDLLRTDDVYVVRGGGPLHGTVRVPGAKNSALKLIAASVLTDEPVTIHNLPDIADIPVMVDLVRSLGADATLADGSVTIVGAGRPGHEPDPAGMAAIRASISLLGPIVGRCRRARLAMPGGDRIGKRAIDFHLTGLSAMGAEVVEGDGFVDVRADDLHGASITLEFPSVGATENLLMAAVLADGVTVIDNAAREPEIQDLCRMLFAMGAEIEGLGTSTLRVTGVEALSGVTWHTVPDRIQAGTWAVAAGVTGGEIRVEGVRPSDLRLVVSKLRAAGMVVDEEPDAIIAKAGQLQACNFVTLPYPGFPTDMQPQMMVLLTQAEGSSRCTENVFESRFSFVEGLQRMGADIVIDGHHAIIRGPSRLTGARLDALDVRAGAAGVLAGLVAEGETVVTDIHHVDRGYHDFDMVLRSLGADIERRPGA
jgi:UDP-N-acetylglucosamine 1-carboxyvinyltransferase